MIPKDLYQKVRRIEITTSRMVTDIFAGEYHSAFKGRGMEFDEVREYQIGDDVRTIDWNVSARTGSVHVKKFIEERELSVMIIVDASSSCQFATARELKSKLAAELAAVIAFSATRNNDKVGLIIFTDRIEKFIPPRKGLRHVLRVIREVLYFTPKGRSTDLVLPLEYLSKVSTRKTVSFMISDFFDPASDLKNTHPAINPAGEGRKRSTFKQALAIANKRHDIVLVTLNDPREVDLPDCGIIHLEDAETGEKILVDSSSFEIRQQYRQQALMRIKSRDQFFQSMGVDHIDIFTDVPYSKTLVKFFLARRRRRWL